MRDTATKSDRVFVEKTPHEEGFAAHFEQHIKPKLLELEETRLNALAASRKRLPFAFSGAVAVAVIAVLLWQQLQDAGEYSFWFAAAFVGSGWFLYRWVRSHVNQYTADRKRVLVPEALKFVGDFRYMHDGKIADRVFNASRLFDKWDKNESGDLITGHYHDRRFQFAEVELSDERGESSEVVFKGCIFILEMPSPMDLTIAVRHKGKVKKWLASVFGSTKDLVPVTFDDVNFREKFEVYSTNEAEAHQLITPPLIHAMLELGELRYAERIEFGVLGRTFLLKIATERDLFEPVDANTSALTSDDSRRFLEELHSVLSIVEILALVTAH